MNINNFTILDTHIKSCFSRLQNKLRNRQNLNIRYQKNKGESYVNWLLSIIALENAEKEIDEVVVSVYLKFIKTNESILYCDISLGDGTIIFETDEISISSFDSGKKAIRLIDKFFNNAFEEIINGLKIISTL